MSNLITILTFFLDNKEGQYSIRQVSELAKMSYKLAYKEVLSLEKAGLISIFPAGKARMCKFIYGFSSKVAEAEEERKKKLFKNKDIELIYNRIMKIKNPLFIFLVFGSYANYSHLKSSDIDICIIADDNGIKKEINGILEATPINSHLNEFSSKEFLSLLMAKKNNVSHEILKNNIILHGIESFFRMVNNAQ